MDEVRDKYRVDIIQYISLEEERIVADFSDYSTDEPERIIDIIYKYGDDISKKGGLAFGKPENAKVLYPDLAAYMFKYALGSVMLVADNDENDKLKGAFAVFSYKRYKNWSEYDRYILPIIFKTLTRLI